MGPERTGAGGKGHRILVVDDEEGFRDSVADLLKVEGYEVSVARDAVEAVPLLPGFRPDVILLDLRMPLLDGESFMRGMRGLSASNWVPVVLVSAKENLAAIAQRCGATACLQKPFEASQLLALIERVLRQPSPKAPR
jgi:DNA-binding response OmpR family regulator